MYSIKKILVFAAIITVVSCGYVLLTPHINLPTPNSWRHELGEGVGGVLAWLLAIIYGRTLLKLLVRNGPLMERLLPEPVVNDTVSLLKKFILFLNKTHPYVGTSAVVFIFGHALLEGGSRANFLMLAILVLALWQFVFGLFLIIRYQAVFIRKLKRYGYMAHSQLYTGVALGIFALFGHILVGD